MAVKTLIMFFLALFLGSRNAFAYLDPGSGSLFIQMLIAALVAIPLTVRQFWKILVNHLKFKRKSKPR